MEALYTYEPNVSYLQQYLYWGIGIFALCAALFYYSLKNNRKLLLLFSGFIGVTALGIGVFSSINEQKIPIVTLYEDGIGLDGNKLTFGKINSIKYDAIGKNTIFPSEGDTARIILIQENSRKVHPLSEDNYPLDDMFGNMAKLLKDYQAKIEGE